MQAKQDASERQGSPQAFFCCPLQLGWQVASSGVLARPSITVLSRTRYPGLLNSPRPTPQWLAFVSCPLTPAVVVWYGAL